MNGLIIRHLLTRHSLFSRNKHMEISKREIIVSIAIIMVMIIIGFFISDKITDYQNDKNAEYQKAVHIEDKEIFQYGMNTNIGNAFVYGELEAVDAVTFDEIGSGYLFIEKVEEHYNRHTRTVTKTKTVNGKTQTYTDTEVYYSWDYFDSWEKHSDKIKFCGIEFEFGKIKIPSKEHIDTLSGGIFSNVRFVYYGVSSKYEGTVYTNLSNGTISENSEFFENCTIEEAADRCTSGIGNIIFWIFWIIITGGCVAGFCYWDNQWLEG